MVSSSFDIFDSPMIGPLLDDIFEKNTNMTALDEKEFPFLFTVSQNRQLAGYGPEVDFTVFAMAIATMSLLLLVEIVRHKIDHIAKGKEFFENVLDAVYQELSTLGIVEGIVFMVSHYYGDMNKNVKQVFAKVHFTLFYVAIINALMSCLLYFCAMHFANKHWVRLETVDVDHYVAIRKKFDALEEQLNSMNVSSDGNNTSMNNQSSNSSNEKSTVAKPLNLFDKSNYRHLLNAKYRKLLVQVRFHELRLHFIESNGLDPRFRVSSYLKLCMNDVFKSLVRISTFAWLILLAFTNLLYFVMSVIVAETDDQYAPGTALSYIFVGFTVGFVLVSFMIARKIKKIFFAIMRHKEWISRHHDGEELGCLVHHVSNILEEHTRGDYSHQVGYFWASDPTLVVTFCQVMQFGYALALGILPIFGKDIFVDETPFQWQGWYLLVPSASYAVFLGLWSTIIPQYTQCTSLGELVNEEHLNTLKTIFELNEAKLIRQEHIDVGEMHGKHMASPKKKPKGEAANKKPSQTNVSLRRVKSHENIKNQQSKNISSVEIEDAFETNSNRSTFSLTASEKLVQLTEMVKRPSRDLPDTMSRSQRFRNRSVSDGVAAMRNNLFSKTSSMATEVLQNESILLPTNLTIDSKPGIKRQKSVSTGVLMMESETSKPLFKDESIGESKINEIVSESMKSDSEASHSPPKSVLKNQTYNHAKEIMNTRDLSLREKERIAIVPEEDQDEYEDSNIESLGNEGFADGRSDNDRADITSCEKIPEVMKKKRLAEMLRGLLMKKSYRQASAVFGTMIAFFMVAMRIEVMLLDICVIVDNQNTWNFISRQTAFWVVVAWLCGFIVEGTTQAILFFKSRSCPHMVIAGVLDCALALACLCIFLRAEAQRCCDCDKTTSNRFIEESSDYLSCDPYHPCCPRFGERLCGGIGRLEPITAIIAFRLMRFAVAKRLWLFVEWLKIKSLESDHVDKIIMPTSGHSSRRQALVHHHGSFSEHYKGTMKELWASAVSKYPDIVATHGMFSGSLLEAMLGIKYCPAGVTSNPPTGILPNRECRKPSVERRQAMIDGKKVQRSVSFGPSILEDNVFDDAKSNFIRPGAPLIQTMRRCQCKWLPLLDDWEVVDVLLTEHELVWLAPISFGSLEDAANNNALKVGGKGMSLSDVVLDRVVLGRLALCDIDHMKVQRCPPLEEKLSMPKISERDVEYASESSEFSSECWGKMRNDTPPLRYGECPDKRFLHVMEDKLILQSPQGTLCLRFLVDLVDEECRRFDDRTTNIYSFGEKNGALSWCQAISHVCGPQQLKQKLNHFGQDEDKELLDFVEMNERKSSGMHFSTRLLGI